MVQMLCLHLLAELRVQVVLQIVLLGLLLIGGRTEHVMVDRRGRLAGLQTVRAAQQFRLEVELSVCRVRTARTGRRQLSGGRRRLAVCGQQ